MQWPAEKIELRSIETLKPYANNPRLHSDAQVQQIARSIGEFGFTMPVLVDVEGNIIAGHGRVMAAKLMGLADVPTVTANGWSEAQRRAYMIADNQLTLNGVWNDELLRGELIALQGADFDLALTGFDEVGLAGLLDALPQGATDPDDAPQAPQEPISRLGDVWVLGRHRLLCGDSTESVAVCAVSNGMTADLMLTDPPYGINIVKVDGATVGGSKAVTIKRTGTIRAHGASPFGGVKNKRGTVGSANWVDANEYLPIYGDDKPFDPEHLIGLAKNHILFGGNYFASKLKDGRCWIVWDKNNTGNFADCELAWTDFDKGAKLYRFTWNGLVREGIRSEELAKRIHPTQKPVGLFASIIGDFSEVNASLIDPYIGSGTSIIACERTNRSCYGIEIEPAYVDVSVQRWQNFTKKKATLDGDGRTFDEISVERKKEAA